MRIIRAQHLGMCFGVRDAIALAIDRSAAAPLTILGDLVHNSTVLARLRAREIAVVHDTVGQPTKQRQDAAVALARQSDVLIVVGGAASNNTRELVNTCSRYCAQVHHIETEADLDPEWYAAAGTVGITAGTSTPDDVID